MSDSLIQLPAIASGASLAGTCLMQTMIFMLDPWKLQAFGAEAPEASETLQKRPLLGTPMLLAVPTFENERGVGPAKAKGVGKDILDRSLAGLVRYVIEVAGRVGCLVV